MERIEMVEKLREKADITMEEAKELLEKNNWDLLDAFVELEKNGKMNAEAKKEEETKPVPVKKAKRRCRLRNTLRNLFRKGIDNKFIVRRNGEELVKVPVILPLLFLVSRFWFTVIALGAGLLFNLKYSFEGKELGKDIINNTMEKAGEAADSIVTTLAEEKIKTEEAEEKTKKIQKSQK